MESKNLTEKTEGKSIMGKTGGADDLVPKSTAGKTGAPADKKHLSPLVVAAVAIALNIEFSSASNGPPEADSTEGNIVCF